MNSNAASTMALASIGLVPALYRPATWRNSTPILDINSVGDGKTIRLSSYTSRFENLIRPRVPRPVVPTEAARRAEGCVGHFQNGFTKDRVVLVGFRIIDERFEEAARRELIGISPTTTVWQHLEQCADGFDRDQRPDGDGEPGRPGRWGPVAHRMLSGLGCRASGSGTRAERPCSGPIRVRSSRRPSGPAVDTKRAASPAGGQRVTVTPESTSEGGRYARGRYARGQPRGKPSVDPSPPSLCQKPAIGCARPATTAPSSDWVRSWPPPRGFGAPTAAPRAPRSSSSSSRCGG